MPVIVWSFYTYNWDELVKDKQFRQIYGTTYAGILSNREEEKTTLAYRYPSLQLGRKLLLAIILT